MSIYRSRKQRLKPMLDKVPPGFLVDSGWLKDQGIDSKSINRYVASGWLERVIRGVYRRPIPDGAHGSTTVSWESTLLSLQRILEYDVYLGGESALDLAGYYHYLRFGEPRQVHFYGNVPAWIKRLPIQTKIVAHRRSLFGDDPTGIGDSVRQVGETRGTVSMWHWSIKASSPERAILEALDELRNRSGFDYLDKIFESLTTLRPKQLMELLTVCSSVKVRRLFFVFADKHQHPWRKHLDKSKIDFGSGPRALVDGGRIHAVYRISVPVEFALTEQEKEEMNG